jgi:hypothetical protein
MAKDQTPLLEELRARHNVAQIRLQEATQAFQTAQSDNVAAQANFQKAQQALVVAQQQFHGWNVALTTVQAEETARKEATATSQMQLPNTAVAPTPVVQLVQQPEPIQPGEQISKTDIVRDLLRQNPQGLTPTEIWSHVHGQFKYRAYLYSVLKRLTDREELSVRRGKYAVRIIPQEMKGEIATIQ